MEAFALYLFKSIVWLTGFALVYLLFLRNERYFLLNRIYLVAGIVASILFPFFTWHYTIVIPFTPSVEVSDLQMTGIVMEPEAFPTKTILLLAYLAGSIYLLYRIIRQTVTVIGVIRHSEILPYRSAKLIRTAKYPASFSFFSFVFVNPSSSETETREIVNHEMEHVRQRHWIDLVLFELLCTIQWLNPMVWLYGRFIRQNHEFLADQCALQRSQNPAIYRAALINQLFGAEVISLANSFNYSINKKRFHMMKNTIHPPYRKLKLLVILPLIAGVFYAFATPEYKYVQAEVNNTQQTEKIITGKVMDDKGNPLSGSAVIISNQSAGTITDNNGVFKLKITDSSPIVVSHVGYESQKLNPDTENEMVITMKPVNIGLGQVIVTGYAANPDQSNLGSSNKVQTNSPLNINSLNGFPGNPLFVIDGKIAENVNANSISINPERIQSVNVIKGEQAISKYGDKGKNGAVEFTFKTGNTATLNQAIKVQANSPLKFSNADGSSAQPLIVIDGVITDNANVGNIPPETIESISVLKDGSATSLYGDKGKNGVILITKKKGPSTSNNNLIDVNINKDANAQKGDKVYSQVEVMPEFPGGDAALRQFIASNVRYPKGAMEKGIQGKVFVTFVVDKTGKIPQAKIVRGVDPLLDQEALRVVNSMPLWKPGMQGGKNVDVEYTIPINFVLQGDTKKSETANGSDSPVFFIVEEMPQFPGGDEALRNFIAATVKYPAAAAQNGIQGKVYVNFVVTKTGSISDAKIVRGVDPLLDQEALRVVNALPTWKPGKQKGEAVRVSYTVPINFVLQGESKKSETTAKEENPVFFIVEQMPEYPGGEEALRNFIAANVKYPALAIEKGIQGKVYINFVVTKTGSVTKAKVARSVDATLDNEAIRVIESMPAWIPGKQGGAAVDVSYTVPINFVLPEKKVSDEQLKSMDGKDNPVFFIVEQMPEFPGGVEALKAYIIANVKYPVIALENGIQGKVFVTFVVSKTGKVKDAKIARGVDPSLDKEAKRVVETMPTWVPGKQGGENVDVAFTLPIEFALPKGYKRTSGEKLKTPYNAQAGKLMIIPNPTKSRATITLEGSDSNNQLQVSVIDSYGKMVKRETKNGPSFTLSVSSLSPGTYRIVAVDGNKQYQGSLIINR